LRYFGLMSPGELNDEIQTCGAPVEVNMDPLEQLMRALT
jgi:hypothetical protein